MIVPDIVAHERLKVLQPLIHGQLVQRKDESDLGRREHHNHVAKREQFLAIVRVYLAQDIALNLQQSIRVKTPAVHGAKRI